MKKVLILILAICIFTCAGCGDKNTSEVNKNSEAVKNNGESEQPSVNLNNTGLDTTLNNTTPSNQENPSKSDTTSDKVDTSSSTSIKDEATKEVPVVKPSTDGVTILKFKNTNSNESIKLLNGKQVSITGYLSTLSPLNGKFAYLMNMPYQSCPFCVPGTAAISNTLAIVAGNNKKIEFTDQPVTVVGTLETGDFSDEFGYQYGVRLNNVKVSVANVDELSSAVKKYNLLAENGVVNNIYGSIMTADAGIYYEYYKLEEPSIISYDLMNSTKSQLNGYNSKGDYNKLVKLLDDLIALSKKANKDIENKDYSKFGSYQKQLQNLYYTFADWMAEGEL